MKWLDNLKIKYGSKYQVIRNINIVCGSPCDCGKYLYTQRHIRNVETNKTKIIKTKGKINLEKTYIYLWW